MSTSRIGPPGSPAIPADTHEAADPAKPTSLKTGLAVADHVTQHVAPKVTDARPQQTTTLAIAAPLRPERRAFLGGDRGAWPQGLRETVLKLADNREIGRTLLDAFNRGFA
jgi:hypothetical protein